MCRNYPFTRCIGKLCPHQPPAGGSFSLRAKSRLRRLRFDTRLRAQPRGGSLRDAKKRTLLRPLSLSKKVCSPLGSLCEGAPPAGGGGENCTAVRNISGYGKVLSLRPFGAPPSQREVFRHAERTLSRPLFYLQIPILLSPPHNKPSGAYQRHGLGGNYRKPDAVHADDKRQGQDGHDLEQQRAQEGDSR